MGKDKSNNARDIRDIMHTAQPTPTLQSTCLMPLYILRLVFYHHAFWDCPNMESRVRIQRVLNNASEHSCGYVHNKCSLLLQIYPTSPPPAHLLSLHLLPVLLVWVGKALHAPNTRRQPLPDTRTHLKIKEREKNNWHGGFLAIY